MMPSSIDPHGPRRKRLAALRLSRLTAVFALTLCVAGAQARAVYVPPVDRSESRAAQEELAAARQAYVRLSVAHNLAQRRVANPPAMAAQPTQRGPVIVRMPSGGARPHFAVPQPAGPEPMIDPVQARLERDVALAIERYQAMRRPLIEAVHDNDDYHAMAIARDDVRRAIDALLASGRPGDPAVLKLSKKALDIGCKMTRQEMLALATDPHVEDARLAMNASSAQLRQYLDVQHVATGMPPRVRPLPAPPPSDNELTAARQRIVAANRRLADALQREAALEQVREMRIAQAQNGQAMSVFGY